MSDTLMGQSVDVKLLTAQRDEALREAERLRVALSFYANPRNWLNDRECRSFPGFHARAVAARALDIDGHGGES